MTVTWLVSAGAVVPTASVTEPQRPGFGQLDARPGCGGHERDHNGRRRTGLTGVLQRDGAGTASDSDGRLNQQQPDRGGRYGIAAAPPRKGGLRRGIQGGREDRVAYQAGGVAPTESVSDSNGFASAVWTLDTASGVRNAYATIVGAPSSRVTFGATALPGPPAAINAATGSGQTTSANHGPFRGSLLAVVTDQYGNKIQGQTVTWSVASGPVVLVRTDQTTDARGRGSAIVSPSGTPGSCRASCATGGREIDAVRAQHFTRDVQRRAPNEWPLRVRQLAERQQKSGGGYHPRGPDRRGPFSSTMTSTAWRRWEPPRSRGGLPVRESVHRQRDVRYAGTYHYADPYIPMVTGVVVVR